MFKTLFYLIFLISLITLILFTFLTFFNHLKLYFIYLSLHYLDLSVFLNISFDYYSKNFFQLFDRYKFLTCATTTKCYFDLEKATFNLLLLSVKPIFFVLVVATIIMSSSPPC